jgi:hypothetical protein
MMLDVSVTLTLVAKLETRKLKVLMKQGLDD